MRLNRTELLNAIKFLKPAILTGSTGSMSCLHVKIDEGKAILTAGNGFVGKRVLLLEPAQLDLIEEPEEPKHYEFMIPRSTLEGFETICQKHKARFKDSPDQTLQIVDITPHFLESHKDKLEYFQPVESFPDLNGYFIGSGPIPATELLLQSEYAIDALKEFKGRVRMMLTGNSGHVQLSNFDESYQAFFMVMRQDKQ